MPKEGRVIDDQWPVLLMRMAGEERRAGIVGTVTPTVALFVALGLAFEAEVRRACRDVIGVGFEARPRGSDHRPAVQVFSELIDRFEEAA